MKSCNVFVEVNSEEIKTAHACINGDTIMLQVVIEVVGGFRGYRANLLITPSIARDEENGNATKLSPSQSVSGSACALSWRKEKHRVANYLFCIIDALLSVEIQRVLGSEPGVFGIKFGKMLIRRAHI